MGKRSFLVTPNREYDLDSLADKNADKISLGRGNGNVIELGDREKDRSVSRSHALITRSRSVTGPDNFYIRDTHSTNGTRLRRGENGYVRISPDDPKYLIDRDELWFGFLGPVFYRQIIDR